MTSLPTLSELRFNDRDRVLVFAPHPDDESIAAGGLLLAARSADAARRVVVLTDGDNNPWPQRWIEKRWRLDAAARTRWGARRRAEAQAALDVLGVDARERQFLGLPDSDLTGLLMRDRNVLPQLIQKQIAEFQPTHIAIPALADRHPDHSAVHIAARFALLEAAISAPQILIYAVHGNAVRGEAHGVTLTEAQREAKRRAILCHDTQMRLSRGRFLGFADLAETYQTGIDALVLPKNYPVQARLRCGEMLELCLDRTNLHRNGRSFDLLIAIQGRAASCLRWRLPRAFAAKQPAVYDAATGQEAAQAAWTDDKAALIICLPATYSGAKSLGYIKLARPNPGLIIYDRYGWQGVEFQPE